MHFKTAASVAVLACAAHASAREANKPYKLTAMSMSLPGLSLARRDTNGYQPEQSTCHDGKTCADACGSGYTQCPSHDDNTHCFNPTALETCCSDGSGNSCDAGYYCSHDHSLTTWCCPENMNLDECAKVYSVSGGLESVAAAQLASSTTAGSSSSTTAAASSTLSSASQAPTSSAGTSSSKTEGTSAGTSQGQTTSGATSTQAGTTAATSGATSSGSETASATGTGNKTAATSAGDKTAADASGAATAAPTGSSGGSTKSGDVAVPTTSAGASHSGSASGTGSLPPLQTNGAGVAASSLGLLLACAGMVALL